MVKILFAIGRLSVGGGEKLLVRQLQHIDRQKFDPYLLTLFPEQKESFEEMLHATVSEAVQFFETRWKKMKFRGPFDAVSLIQLVRFLRKEKFDAVVTSLFSANLLVRFALLCAGAPKASVSYEHNIYADKHRWQIIADRFLARRTKKIIVDSEVVRQFTAEQERIPIDKFLTLYIPPLLDEKKINAGALRKKTGIPERALVVTTVSRLVEEKGHRYLIDAAKKVLEKFPEVYFLIVGWGPLEQTLKEQAKNLGVSNRVLIPGRMDIQDILAIADIYVDPATRTDLPVGIMEAMKSGKSVIASDIGEIGVFVKNNLNGFLVSPKDGTGLAEKIELLLSDQSLRERFGNAAAETVKSYSIENYMKNFEDLILNILGVS